MKSTKTTSSAILRFAVFILIGKVLVDIVSKYVDYWPPNLNSDFLILHRSHFAGAYKFAFYVHIISSPVSLLNGMVLMSTRLRTFRPAFHRCLGKFQVALVITCVAPSGLWMSFFSFGGAKAGLAFGVLALLTGWTVAKGWRAAIQRKFSLHQVWMTRCFMLLCSAVLLRLISGTAGLFNFEGTWAYVIAAWMSWLLPLSTYEVFRIYGNAISRNETK